MKKKEKKQGFEPILPWDPHAAEKIGPAAWAIALPCLALLWLIL